MMDASDNGRTQPCGHLSLGNCEEAMERLDDYLDRDLTCEDREELEAHLKLCDHCTHEYGLRSAAQDILRCKLLGEKCPDSLRSSIFSKLRDECA